MESYNYMQSILQTYFVKMLNYNGGMP